MKDQRELGIFGSPEEIAIQHGDRTMKIENPKIQNVEFMMSREATPVAGRGSTAIEVADQKTVEVSIDLVATNLERTEGGSNLPSVVDDMSVEELLDAVNQKIEER